MLKNPSISYRNSRPLKDYSATGRANKQHSPLRVKTGGTSRSPVMHDRINSSYVPRRMKYHNLGGKSLADQRDFSRSNLDLPMDTSPQKQDPKEANPNWLSMRTGGQYSKFQDEGGSDDQEQQDQDEQQYKMRKEKVQKAIEDDRKIIDDAKKTNAPIYSQVDVSSFFNDQA